MCGNFVSHSGGFSATPSSAAVVLRFAGRSRLAEVLRDGMAVEVSRDRRLRRLEPSSTSWPAAMDPQHDVALLPREHRRRGTLQEQRDRGAAVRSLAQRALVGTFAGARCRQIPRCRLPSKGTSCAVRSRCRRAATRVALPLVVDDPVRRAASRWRSSRPGQVSVVRYGYAASVNHALVEDAAQALSIWR
jgi:hypothetical protein